MEDKTWRVIVSEDTDPATNLAIDEAILRLIIENKVPNTLRLWRSQDSVVIGRCQDLRAEVNLQMCKDLKVPVFRRCSGGGTVFMDLGNFNYSVIAHERAINGMKTVHQVSRFICSAVMKLLSQLGCQSRFVYPSSVFVGDRKLSGSAQYMLYEGILHHGTLLVNANLEMMQKVLSPNPTLARSLGAIPSTPSLVVNLSFLIQRELRFEEVTNLLVDEIMNVLGGNSWISGSLTKGEYRMAQLLHNIKYSDSHWLLGTNG